MHGRLLGLGGDIAAGGNDNKWVGFAVRVLEVEAAEEDGRGGDDALLEGELLAQLTDDCGGC